MLNADFLQEQHIQTLSSALDNISGAMPSDPSEILLVNPLIRGFEAELYVDGLLGYGDTAVLDPASMIGIERIEVAKGPTSTLYGGGTGAPVGGLINLVTKTPKPDATYQLGARIGSFNTRALSFDVNQPLSQTSGLRIAAEWQDAQDFIDDVESTRLAIYPSFRAALSQDTELLLRSFYTKVDYLEYSGLPFVVANQPGVDRFQFSGASNMPQTEVENTSVHLSITHDLDENWSLQIQGRRYTNEFTEVSTFTYLAFFPVKDNSAPILSGFLPADVKQLTLDASAIGNLTIGDVDHEILLGVSYDDTDYQGGMAFNFTPIGTVNYASGENTASWSSTPSGLTKGVNQYASKAIYAQDTISFNHWHLLLSARWSQYALKESGNFNPSAPFDFDYTQFDPRIGISYQLNDAWSLFAGYATGSRLTLFFNASGDAPKPERSNSAELGVKFDISSLGLAGSLAAYTLTRENIPTSAFPKPGSIQTAEQQSEGVELDLIWEPTDQFSVLVALAYTNAEITKDIVSFGTTFSAGNALSRVPKTSGRVAGRYRFDNGIGLSLGLTYREGAPLTEANKFSTHSYAAVDLKADYRLSEQHKIALSITNLFDREYWMPYQFFAQDVVRPGQPLSAQLSYSATF